VCGRGAYSFGVQPEGKRLLERLTRRWEDNIRMDLPEKGRGSGLD